MRQVVIPATLAIVTGALIWTVSQAPMTVPPDVRASLDVELTRWEAAVADPSRGGEFWNQVKTSAAAVLTQARQAYEQGRLRVAAERLSVARQNLSAATYTAAAPEAARTTIEGLEAEWRRMGSELGVERDRARRHAAAEGSALRRAVDQIAFLQVRVNYDASLIYGKNTTPASGLAYVGIARAQHELRGLTGSLFVDDVRRLPAVRSIRPDIDALQSVLLARYRPPASIDRHPDFIATSSLLKEARELDAAGLRFGALLRYLQAAMRFGMLEAATGPGATRAAIAEALAAAGARLGGGTTDHSVGQLFVERGEFELGHDVAETPGPIAQAIASEVLPRYFAAIIPAAPRPAAVPPAVTVTLVRWPYT